MAEAELFCPFGQSRPGERAISGGWAFREKSRSSKASTGLRLPRFRIVQPTNICHAILGGNMSAIKLSRRRFVGGAAILAAGVIMPRGGVAHAATAQAADGTNLFYEATGRGPPIV